jgi:hypothetical protein
MNRSYYDPVEMLTRSHLWSIEASEATLPSMREFCLAEAAHCTAMVQRSFYTPVLIEQKST